MSRDLTRLRPRQTIHNGVTMRSRLEAGFARWCDEAAIEWQYEPYVLSGDGGQWLPDFLLPRMLWVETTNDRDCVIEEIPTFVEVKYAGWDDEAELNRISRVFESGAPRGRLVLARPDGLELFSSEIGFLYRSPLRLPRCDAPKRLTVGFQEAETEIDGPWTGDWWRK